MPDNPSDQDGSYGCVDIPFLGTLCVSDVVDYGKDIVGDEIQDRIRTGRGTVPRTPLVLRTSADPPIRSSIVPDSPYVPDAIEEFIYGPPAGSNGTVARSQVGHGCCPTGLFATPSQTARLSCPKGYVLVDDPQSGAPTCMLRGEAIKCGLWRPARKPPIKASDYRCLMRSASVIKKMDRIVAATNKITGKARLTRSRR